MSTTLSTTGHPGCNGTTHQPGCPHLSGESDLDLVAAPPTVEPEKTRAFGDTQDPRLAEREGRVDADLDDNWAKFLDGTAQMRSYSANNQSPVRRAYRIPRRYCRRARVARTSSSL